MNPQIQATASKTASTFRMQCAVQVNIKAAPETVWQLLTNAAGFPGWNSTVTSIEGDIAQGNKLTLRTPTSSRTFTPTVTSLVPHERMVWADGMAPMFKGERTFTLAARGDGTTDFSMDEVFTGLMLPMIKGSLPDFAPIFEAYARDLKRAAERAAGAS